MNAASGFVIYSTKTGWMHKSKPDYQKGDLGGKPVSIEKVIYITLPFGREAPSQSIVMGFWTPSDGVQMTFTFNEKAEDVTDLLTAIDIGVIAYQKKCAALLVL